MEGSVLVGGVLVAGLGIFLVGASAWRLEYQRPLPESLLAVHRDRRRWTWIHVWMVAGVLVTSAGLAGLAQILAEPIASALAGMAAAVYVSGGVCWIASIAFRLTVVPWAAERAAADGDVSDGFIVYDRWAGALYCVHMLSAYAASAVLGLAVLQSDPLPTWLGWVGVGWGLAFAIGLVATRFAGPFNPPFWAHLYTAGVGAYLLLH
ncbi:hypothetical protein ISU10_15955 [Nocardioides agariphilus]|uniref:Uncharacterized protein n=1 Tax=Nocardioides agariphilus TaxID=433664 RepID=A0A930VP70_9ACTN|nr:hypothetical protein [Nocardioides agariphilus]MBF4769261.1 hypothetical protein [Nocardioides agariphilus]